MARAKWDALSEADKNAVSAAAREATTLQRNLSQQENAMAKIELQRHGMLIQEADVASFNLVSKPIYDKWLASPVGDFLRMLIAAKK